MPNTPTSPTELLHLYRDSGEPVAARAWLELLLAHHKSQAIAAHGDTAEADINANAALIIDHINRETLEACEGTATATDLSLLSKKTIQFLLNDLAKVHRQNDWRRFLLLCLLAIPLTLSWTLQLRPAISNITDLRVLGVPALMLFTTTRTVAVLGAPKKRAAVPVFFFIVAFLFLNISFFLHWRETPLSSSDSSLFAGELTCLLTLFASSFLAITAIQYLVFSVGPLLKRGWRIILNTIAVSTGLVAVALTCGQHDIKHMLIMHLGGATATFALTYWIFERQFRLQVRKNFSTAIATRILEKVP